MNRTFPALLILCASCTSWYSPPPDSHYASKKTGIDIVPRANTEVQYEFTGELDLSRALARAWDHHPSMKRARALISASRGERLQAGLWPNPELQATHLEESERKRVTTLMIAQKLELGGKVGARISAAEAGIILSQARLVETWAAVRAGVKEAFAGLAYAQQRLEAAKRMAAIDREALSLTRSLFKGGKVPEMDYLRIVRREGESRTILRQAEALAGDARRKVFVAMGVTRPDAKSRPACSLDIESPLAGDFGRLLAMAEEKNPSLARAGTNIAVARARHRLARTKVWSDVTVGLGARNARYYYEGNQETNSLMANLSFDLPVWNQYQGDIAAARARVRAAEQARSVTATEVAGQISELFADRSKWSDEKGILGKSIIPAAKRQAALMEDSFKKGKASRLDVLRFTRDLEVLGLRLLQVRFFEAVSIIQLERIAGIALDPEMMAE